MKNAEKAALGVGLVAALVGTLLLATRAEAKPRLKGDLDNDGQVTRQDLTILEDLLSGYITMEDIAEAAGITVDEAFWRADVNGDGQINILDVIALVQKLPF